MANLNNAFKMTKFEQNIIKEKRQKIIKENRKETIFEKNPRIEKHIEIKYETRCPQCHLHGILINNNDLSVCFCQKCQVNFRSTKRHYEHIYHHYKGRGIVPTGQIKLLD